MKEQWKKLDSDAKLLVNVEEGRSLPIKIELPVPVIVSDRCGFCYRPHCASLKTIFFLVLLGILSWSAANLYTKYYSRSIFEPDKKIVIENEPLHNPVFKKLEFIKEVYNSIPDVKINTLRPYNVFANTNILPAKLSDEASTTNIAHESTSHSIIDDPPVVKSVTKTNAEDKSLFKSNEIQQNNSKHLEKLNQDLQNNLNKIKSSENYKSDENGEDNYNYLLFEQILRDITGVDSEKFKNIEKSNEDADEYNLSRETKNVNENEMIHILNEFMNSIVTEKNPSTEHFKSIEDTENQEKNNSEEKIQVVNNDMSANVPENASENDPINSGSMSSFEHKSSEEKPQNSQENSQSFESKSAIGESSEVMSDNKEITSDSHQDYKDNEEYQSQHSQETYETASRPMSSFEHKSSEEKPQNSQENSQSFESKSAIGESSEVVSDNKEITSDSHQDYKDNEEYQSQHSQETYGTASGPMSSFEHKSSEEKSQNSQENSQSFENKSAIGESSEVMSDNKEITSDSHQDYKDNEDYQSQHSQETYGTASGPMSSFEHKSSEEKPQNSQENSQSFESKSTAEGSIEFLLDQKQYPSGTRQSIENIKKGTSGNSQEIYEMVFGPLSSFEHKSSDEKFQKSRESLQSFENKSAAKESSEVFTNDKINTSDSEQNYESIEQINSNKDSYNAINKDKTLKIPLTSNVMQKEYMYILMAEKLESIIGNQDDLFSWYYSNRNNPNFIADDNKLKAYTAKLLFDTDIKDFKSDTNIVYNLIAINSQEKIIRPETIRQVYIIHRLNIKNYMFNLYVKGLQSAEDISSAIEELNRIEFYSPQSNENNSDIILNIKNSSKSVENINNDSEESVPKTDAEFEKNTKSVIEAMRKGAIIDDYDQTENPYSDSNSYEQQLKIRKLEDRFEETIESIFKALVDTDSSDYHESFVSYYGDEYEDK